MKTRLTLFLLFKVFIPGMIIAQSGLSFGVNPNGTFRIEGNGISLENCYPALDGQSLKPLAVEVSESEEYAEIIYRLEQGIVQLKIKNSGNEISIETSIVGKEIKPSTFSPVARAEVQGAERFYKSPWAIADNAGIKDWPTDQKKEISNSLTGLIPAEGNTLVISTRDYRRFFSYADIYPAGLFNDRKSIDITILTEEVDVSNLPAVFITEGSTPFVAMNKEAKQIARVMGARNETPQTYHWCSWYYAYYYLTEKKLFDYLDGFEKVEPRVPVQTIQIDVGYFPHVGDWLEPGCNFPNGIKESIEKIKDHNYRAGIWIAPYMVGNRSKLYREHPEWILRNKDGSIAHVNKFYDENRLWGAFDEEYYLLDTSNPAVMEYLRNVFRTFREMGITFFKTDFMFWGAKPSPQVDRYTPGKTSAEYQRELYEMIREEIGDESFWLGCISNYAPMIGFVDAMRISWDIGANWSYAQSFFREVQGQQFFNNVWWQNDPDAIILRTEYNHMKEHEVETLALYMGMLGGAVNTSDLFHEIPEKLLNIFLYLQPGDEKNTASFPFLGTDRKTDVLVRPLKPGNGLAVLFVNRENTSVTERFKIRELTGHNKATCYYWNTGGSILIGEIEELIIELDPHHHKLVYISPEGKAPDDINFAGKKLNH